MTLDPWANLAIAFLLVGLVFAPIKFVYPSRTVRHRRLTLLLTAAWGLVMVAALVRYPDHEAWLVGAALAYALFYFGISTYHMRNARRQRV